MSGLAQLTAFLRGDNPQRALHVFLANNNIHHQNIMLPFTSLEQAPLSLSLALALALALSRSISIFSK